VDDIHRMLALVKDPNPQIRKYALTQVEELTDGVDDEDVLEVLRDAARDNVPLVSHQAIRSLARLLGKAFMAEPSMGGDLGSEVFEGTKLSDLRTAGLGILRPAIERLHDIVRGEDKRAARRALIALGKIAAPGSTEVVAACLGDQALAGAAAIALPGIGGEEALRPLLEAARDQDSPGRLHAVLELGHFREETARGLLLDLARDENAAIRANAAMALGEQRTGGDSREVLGALLSDAEVWVTVYAIRSLARDACEESAQLVASTYHKVEDPHVQASCLAVLGSMGPVALAPAESVLLSGIGHPDDRVRANAVEAASSLIEEKVRLFNLIAPLSTDPNNRVLANVAVGLARYDIPAALEILQRLSQSGDRWFQTSAVWAAGAIGKLEAFVILTQLAASQETSILLMIVRSLDAFPAAESLPLLTRLAICEDEMVRTRAAETLGKIGGDQVCLFLSKRFEMEKDEVARGALVNALALTRASGVTTVLMQALADSHPRVQANAVEALGRVGSLDVLSAVRPFASGAKSRLQANAWIALWRLGEMEMAEEAARSLMATNQEGIASSIYAMGEMGRELRQLGQHSSNLLLLSALKDRTKGGGD
jgi:HEAT repeat protein